MFIIKDHRRINLFNVKEYKPVEKDNNYLVEFTYDNNNKEEFNFNKDQIARNKMIDAVDKMCLNITSFFGGSK